MKIRCCCLVAMVVAVLGAGVLAQDAPAAKKAKGKGKKADIKAPANTKVFTYKHTPQGELQIEFCVPADWKASDRRPGIVFFFGGGWTHGNRSQFYVACEYLAKRGMVAGTADYRIGSTHHTTVVEAAEDAKSAIRWTRQHASELGIDPEKLAGGGGSAGGHLAGFTGVCPGFDAAGEDKSVSSKPNVLVLFNPVLDLRDLGLGERVLGATAEEKKKVLAELSPAAFVTKDAPPMVAFFGSEDRLIATARPYVAEAKKLGVKAEILVAPGEKHGFFNRPPWQQSTLRAADEFLESVGYLKGPPTIETPTGAELQKDDGKKVAAQ